MQQVDRLKQSLTLLFLLQSLRESAYCSSRCLVLLLLFRTCCPVHRNSSCSVTGLNVIIYHTVRHIPEEKEIRVVFILVFCNVCTWSLYLDLQQYILLMLFRQFMFNNHMLKRL